MPLLQRITRSQTAKAKMLVRSFIWCLHNKASHLRAGGTTCCSWSSLFHFHPIINTLAIAHHQKSDSEGKDSDTLLIYLQKCLIKPHSTGGRNNFSTCTSRAPLPHLKLILMPLIQHATATVTRNQTVFANMLVCCSSICHLLNKASHLPVGGTACCSPCSRNPLSPFRLFANASATAAALFANQLSAGSLPELVEHHQTLSSWSRIARCHHSGHLLEETSPMLIVTKNLTDLELILPQIPIAGWAYLFRDFYTCLNWATSKPMHLTPLWQTF